MRFILLANNSIIAIHPILRQNKSPFHTPQIVTYKTYFFNKFTIRITKFNNHLFVSNGLAILW